MTASTTFVEHIASDVTFQFSNRLRRIADQLRLDASSRSSFLSPIDGAHSQIREDIDTLAAFASGRSNTSRQQIESLIDNLTNLLFETTGGTRNIPEAFWTTQLGQLIMRCHKRIHQNNWMTHTEAATVIYGDPSKHNLIRLRRLIDTGVLSRFIDPDASNLIHAGRVLRTEAIAQAVKQGQSSPR